MTVPAPTLLPRAAVSAPFPGSAPAAANLPASGAETTGFAAHLAREALPTGDAPAIAVLPHAAAGQVTAKLADPVFVPTSPAEPGKPLPHIRQTPAAAALSPAHRLLAAPAAREETALAAPGTGNQAEAELTSAAPGAELAALILALPGAAVLPVPAAPAPTVATAAARPAAGPTPSAASAPIALPTGTSTGTLAIAPQTNPQAVPAAQVVHPAVLPAAPPTTFAIASLVLEREPTAEPAPAPGTAPGTGTPGTPDQAAQQAAARAQPSTFAALTGAPAPERPAARKPRAEAETTLLSAQTSAPEAASALAFAAPPAAPAPLQAASSAAAVPPAAGPQPISFDQLVDSIARARDGAELGGAVAIAMHHGDFGRISLSIERNETGLSVALASADPAFAPAAAAAHAAANAEAPRPASANASADPRGETGARDMGQGSPSGQSGQHREGHRSEAHRGEASRSASPSTQPRLTPHGETAATETRRSGIFA